MVCRCLPLGDVDLGLLAHGGGEAATNTLDGGQSVHDLLLSIDVGVEHTKNVLEFSLVDKSLRLWLESNPGYN